jgi:plasmid stability protein
MPKIKRKQLVVRLDENLIQELRVYAAQHKTTTQAVVEQAVIAKIRRGGGK